MVYHHQSDYRSCSDPKNVMENNNNADDDYKIIKHTLIFWIFNSLFCYDTSSFFASKIDSQCDLSMIFWLFSRVQHTKYSINKPLVCDVTPASWQLFQDQVLLVEYAFVLIFHRPCDRKSELKCRHSKERIKLRSFSWIDWLTQGTKKFRSDSPGLADFVVGLVEFLLHLPNRQVKVFEEIFLSN